MTDDKAAQKQKQSAAQKAKLVENGMKKGTGKASDKVINSSNEYVKHSLENTVENAKLNQAQSIIKTLGQQNGQREFGKYKGGY